MSTERFVLQQQRDLGQIIEAAVSIYSQHFWQFFSIAAVLIPFGILSSVLTALLPSIDNPVDEEEVARVLVIAVAILLPLAILQAIAQWIASLAIMAAVADLDAEREPELSHAMRQRGSDFSRAYQAVFSRFWTLFGASLRAAIVVIPFLAIFGISFALYLGAPAILGLAQFVLFIPVLWAIRQAIRWLFIHQAVLFDGTSARAALSYSADAVQGRWWRTLGIAITLLIIVQVPAAVIGALVGFAPALISDTAGAVITAAILPLGVIAMTLLYLDLKARRETDVQGFGPA